MASDALPRSARRVRAALDELGIDARIVVLPDSAHTAVEAARAIGCRVEQIAKSLVFLGARSADGYLVVASGPRRVDEAALAALAGEPIERADAAAVRRLTGFAIGGVAPVGLASPLTVLIERHLLDEGEIWAAAGTPNAVMALTADQLVQATGGRVADLG